MKPARLSPREMARLGWTRTDPDYRDTTKAFFDGWTHGSRRPASEAIHSVREASILRPDYSPEEITQWLAGCDDAITGDRFRFDYSLIQLRSIRLNTERHTHDDQCIVEHGICAHCGVGHGGDPCPGCGGTAFHREGCTGDYL